MAFTIKEYASQKSHSEFLEALACILPSGCQPIVITDAGFRCPWFKLVCSKGWNYVGRVRNRTLYKNPINNCWESVKLLYVGATHRARYVCKTMLAKANSEACYFYTMRNDKQYRSRKNLAGKKIQCSVSLKHARGGNEPWVIVASLSNEKYTAKQIMNFYKKRMQIEESFRDLKNTRNGFGLRHCRARHVRRFDVALLMVTGDR